MQIRTTEDIKQLGTILGIWAHPDDDTYSMGGIMAAAVQNGQAVHIITATRGEAGVQDGTRWPADRLAEIRTAEMAEALKALGVSDHTWLDYPDGGCKHVDETEAVERIAELINRCNPDSIMTFGPEGMTGHDDHKTVSHWAELATERAGSKASIYHAVQTTDKLEAMLAADERFNIFFNIDQPPVRDASNCAVCFEMDVAIYNRKLAALRAMPSQTEAMLQAYGEAMAASLAVEAFIEARRA